MSCKKYQSTDGEEQISKIASSTYSAEISHLKEAQIKKVNVRKIFTILLAKDNKEIQNTGNNYEVQNTGW